MPFTHGPLLRRCCFVGTLIGGLTAPAVWTSAEDPTDSAYWPDVPEPGSVEAIREYTTSEEYLPETVAFVPESKTVPSPTDFLGHLVGAPGELRFPYNVDLLSDGTLVVCEYGNNRVQRFDTDGRSLGTWGQAGRRPGELAYPWALVVGQGDRVLIVDSGNNRVQVIDGRAARTWSRP